MQKADKPVSYQGPVTKSIQQEPKSFFGEATVINTNVTTK